jgi:hypothetical protein
MAVVRAARADGTCDITVIENGASVDLQAVPRVLSFSIDWTTREVVAVPPTSLLMPYR